VRRPPILASLVGGTIVDHGSEETAGVGRVPFLEVRRPDGSTVLVSFWCDEEGNGPGAPWLNEVLPQEVLPLF